MVRSLSPYVIIADDLTGANDTGLQFAKQAFRTFCLLDMAEMSLVSDRADVLVINSETRSLTQEEAYQKTEALIKRFSWSPDSTVYKKIDSTMRGNIGSEIDALMDHVPFDFAVVVPAYPKNKRVTIGGYHLLNDLLLEDSEIARDPKTPVKESHLPTLLAGQSKRQVGHIELRVIRKGKIPIIQQINVMLEKGCTIITCDGVSDSDLQNVVESVLESKHNVLWVGSAGLAQCLSQQLRVSVKEDHLPEHEQLTRKHQELVTFVVAGSVSAVTRKQVETLGAYKGFTIITADPLECMNPNEQERIVGELLKVIDQNENPILTTNLSHISKQRLDEWMQEMGKDGTDMGNAIAEGLGLISAAVLRQRKVGGLVATGGDIAYQTCCALGISALQIVDEVEEGIPLSRVVGGPFHHLPIVTKAGAFGNHLSLVNASNKIKQILYQKHPQ